MTIYHLLTIGIIVLVGGWMIIETLHAKYKKCPHCGKRGVYIPAGYKHIHCVHCDERV